MLRYAVTIQVCTHPTQLSESVPSHCSAQYRGCLLLSDRLTLTVKTLRAFATSRAVCPTTQRYVPRTWVSWRTSHRRGWCLTLYSLGSSCIIRDVLCRLVVAVCSAAPCGTAWVSWAPTWHPRRTLLFTWSVWHRCRTIYGSTVRDYACDDKCYEDGWRKARHGPCDPLRTVRSSWKWQQYHSSTLVLNRSLMELKWPGRDAYI